MHVKRSKMHVASGIKAWFGGVCIPKMFCEACKSEAFVIKGLLACCDSPIQTPQIELQKREADTNKRIHISVKKSKEILRSQDNRCGFCLYRIGTRLTNEKTGKNVKLQLEIDHFIPWTYLATNQGELVGSCQLCNRIKSNKVFDSIDSARVFLKMERARKGWPNEGMCSAIWTHVKGSLVPGELGNDFAPQDVVTHSTTGSKHNA